jgi:hypothetical protein
MIWKRIEQASPPSDQTWKQIDQTPIPLSSGRIWLADKDGNVTRALGWTWRILKRREPRKYRWWIIPVGPSRPVRHDKLAACCGRRSSAHWSSRRARQCRRPNARNVALKVGVRGARVCCRFVS